MFEEVKRAAHEQRRPYPASRLCGSARRAAEVACYTAVALRPATDTVSAAAFEQQSSM